MDAIEAQQRQAVIAEARTWLGTPFHNGAKIKGAGVDCAMLIEAVFVAVGIIEETYPGRYSSQWHLHRDEERYLAWANHLAVEVDRPQPGDVAIWKFGRCYSHAGLIIDSERVLHAYADNHAVEIDLLRMGALSVRPTAKGTEPRPVKYFDVFARRRLSASAISA
jgi:NlpC/P60 family putative phage cell wall peptidase